MKRRIALLLAVILLVTGVAGCHTKSAQESGGNGEINYQPVDTADAVAHEDDTSVYDYIGKYITIDMVQENPETGLAYVTYENTTYELGMDFLSKAMVHNFTVPKASAKYTSRQEVFYGWWRLYMQRWNYLVPEIPLYNKQDHYIYNLKIQNFAPNPYWSAADAIVGARVEEEYPNGISVGSAAALTGAFRAEGQDSGSSADADIVKLTTGYSLVSTKKNGEFVWNEAVLAATPAVTKNVNGTTTYTIKIKNNLLFSDGTKITARDYLAPLLVSSSAVGRLVGVNSAAGEILAGYEKFNVYDGTNHGKAVQVIDKDGKEKTDVASRSFSGLKLVNEFCFSITLAKDYTNYYYAPMLMCFAPAPAEMYTGGYDILVAQNRSVYLSDGFYARTAENEYAITATIQENLQWDSGFPYSGPYVVSDFDATAQIATLTVNPKYAGESERGKASIETVTYANVEPEQKMQLLQQGQLDMLAEPLETEEMAAAQELAQQLPERLALISAEQAGYGKLALRCDYGPTSMVQVRRAIMYAIAREELNQQLPQGGGELVHGPFHSQHPAYQAVKQDILLNPYAYSVEDAIASLVAGGWVYNEKGQPYTQADAVRYKKLSGYELSEDNLKFQSVDGKYKTLKINGEYYMPLAINWYGTQPNSVTDALVTAWQSNPAATTQLGMYVSYTPCTVEQGVYGELYRDVHAGYDGTPKLNAINFATTFPSAMYDYSWYWSIRQKLVGRGYSVSFLRDEADYLESYK